MYRRYLPQISLSLERNTDKVPGDGKYYLLKNGEIVKIFRSKSKAEEEFNKIVDECGLKPKTIDMQNTEITNEAIYRFLRDRSIFHAEGAKYRGKGGRGR